MEHLLLFVVAAFLLYHLMGSCGCNGFSVGGNEADCDNAINLLEKVCCDGHPGNCPNGYPKECNEDCKEHLKNILISCSGSQSINTNQIKTEICDSCGTKNIIDGCPCDLNNGNCNVECIDKDNKICGVNMNTSNTRNMHSCNDIEESDLVNFAECNDGYSLDVHWNSRGDGDYCIFSCVPLPPPPPPPPGPPLPKCKGYQMYGAPTTTNVEKPSTCTGGNNKKHGTSGLWCANAASKAVRDCDSSINSRYWTPDMCRPYPNEICYGQDPDGKHYQCHYDTTNRGVDTHGNIYGTISKMKNGEECDPNASPPPPPPPGPPPPPPPPKCKGSQMYSQFGSGPASPSTCTEGDSNKIRYPDGKNNSAELREKPSGEWCADQAAASDWSGQMGISMPLGPNEICYGKGRDGKYYQCQFTRGYGERDSEEFGLYSKMKNGEECSI